MKKNAVFEDVLGTITKYFVVLVVAVVVCICFSGVRFVKSGEVALVLRFGKLVGDTYEDQVHEPGLMFAFPYIIDEVVTVPVGNVIEKTVTTHYTEGEMTTLRENGYVITGDQNIAVMSASVKYVISDPVAYALKVKDVDMIINACVSNAMVESAARTAVDDILTSGKEAFVKDITTSSQAKLDSALVGVEIQTIELTSVRMPEEVRTTYESVNAATVQANTMIENAYAYRENVIPMAEAVASSLVTSASSAYSVRTSGAASELAEFWGVLEEYNTNPALVRARIYNTKVAEIIQNIGKIRVVTDGESKIFIN